MTNSRNTRRGCTQKNQYKTKDHSRMSLSGMTPNLDNAPLIRPLATFPPHGEAANLNVPSTLRERVECVSTGVRGYRKGFTLIELLVVVLIIGILAAVALPQYQKAVEKSRTREAVLMLKNMQKAVALCYLQYGDRAEECGVSETGLFAHMDIELPGTLIKGQCDSGGACYLTRDWLYDWDGFVLYAFRVTDRENLLNGPYVLCIDEPWNSDTIRCAWGSCEKICGSNICVVQ